MEIPRVLRFWGVISRLQNSAARTNVKNFFFHRKMGVDTKGPHLHNTRHGIARPVRTGSSVSHPDRFGAKQDLMEECPSG